MAYIPNPNLPMELKQRLKLLTVTAAEAASEVLAFNLNSSSHGSGKKWPQNPFPSSAPDEFPVKQTGQLQSGVGFDPNTPEEGAQVFIEDDYQKLIDLEFAPPTSNPNPAVGRLPRAGGRAPMWRTMTSPEAHMAMKMAMEQV